MKRFFIVESDVNPESFLSDIRGAHRSVAGFLMLMAFCLALYGCGKQEIQEHPAPPEPPAETVQVDSIWLSTDKAIVSVGATLRMTAGYAPSDAAFEGFGWESSDNSVASVDASGRVTGVSAGFADISVIYGDLRSSCKVMVKDPAAPQIGYYYYSDGTWAAELDPLKVPLGIIFYVNPDGKGGKMLNVEEGDAIWGVPGESGAGDEYDGAANTELIMSREEYRYRYPVVAWVADLRTAAVSWYLPAKYELQQIYAGASGLQWMESGADEFFGQVDAWRADMSVLKDEKYRAARDEFNRKIGLIPGGTGIEFDRGNAYWSSTEEDENDVWLLALANGIMNTSGKDSGYGRIRAIAVF